MLYLIETRDYLFCYLKKMQAENALEWEKREHVESEELALERETKASEVLLRYVIFDRDKGLFVLLS